MKRNNFFIGLQITLLLILLVSVLGMAVFASETNSAAQALISSYSLSEGEISMVDEVVGINNTTVQEYTDDNYSYFYNVAEQTVKVITMNDDKMDSLVEASTIAAISEAQKAYTLADAEEDVLDIIAEYFPKYDRNSLDITVNTNSGNPIEFYRYTIYEYRNGVRLNRALISLSYDGQLTLLHGTNNEISEAVAYAEYDEEDIHSIAFDYMQVNIAAMEEEMNTIDIAPEENGALAAIEEAGSVSGMALPGYEIYLDTLSDMDIIEEYKVFYKDTVAWYIEYIVDTSWGAVDPALNICFGVYIDASSGEILDVFSTSGK